MGGKAGYGADGLYATHSVGRIVESDHDWLIAVLSDRNQDLDAGKAVIEATVTRAMDLLRGALR